MLQVPGAWISENMFDRLVQDLARVPLIPKHQIHTYAQAFPYMGSKKSEHSKRKSRGLSWPLTTEQQKIVQMMAEGKHGKEIALAMGKSGPEAIWANLARARARAGCNSNEELVARAVASRIITVKKPLDVENTPGKLVVTIAGKKFSYEEELREPADNFEREVGKRLQEARVQAGYSQGEVGAVAGISKGRMTHIENGVHMPSMKQYLTLCAAYNKSPSELMPDGYGTVTNRRDPRAFVDHLSNAEREMLAFLADGLSYAEIALKRGVSIETVKTQLRLVREKLGAKNAAHVVALSYRNGALR